MDDSDIEWDALIKSQRAKRLQRLYREKSIHHSLFAMIIGVDDETLDEILAGNTDRVNRHQLGDGADNIERHPREWSADTRKLMDILFSIVSTIHSEQKWLADTDREVLMEWVRQQLRGCGFPVYPVGSSWGSLI